MKIDWKLKGFNLARFTCNKNAVLHPETCSDMVLMKHDDTSPLSLKNWITSNGATEMGSSLGDWLLNYSGGSLAITVNAQYTPSTIGLDASNSIDIGYIGSSETTHIRVPLGTAFGLSSSPTAGVFRAGSGLNVSSTTDQRGPGILSVAEATNDDYGGIKLGYTNNENNNRYKPVELDSQTRRAFVDVGAVSSVLRGWDGVNTINDLSYQGNPITSSIYRSETDVEKDFQANNEYGNKVRSQFSTITNSKISWSQSVIDQLYPIYADYQGILYTYVPWTDTNSTYDLTKDGNVLYFKENGTTTRTLTLPTVPANNVTAIGSSNNSIAKFNGSYEITAGPSFGNDTTKYLNNKGNWAVPTDTQYGSDEDTILMDVTTNKFSDPHQHTFVVDNAGLLYPEGKVNNKEVFTIDNDNVLSSFLKFKKTNYTVVVAPNSDSDNGIKSDIDYILGLFGSADTQGNEDNYGTLIYKCSAKGEITCTVNGREGICEKMSEDELILQVYGDITVSGDADNGLTFVFGNSVNASNITLTFEYTVFYENDFPKQCLNIVCDVKDIVFPNGN